MLYVSAIERGAVDRCWVLVPILEIMDANHQTGSSPLGRRAFLAGAGLTGAAVAMSGLLLPETAFAADGLTKRVIGHSTKGRPIKAWCLGDPDAKNVYLVMGQMHGDEPAGRLLTHDRLLNKDPVKDVALWVVPTMNPDGNIRGTRVNARGVDLNRNFPSKTWVKLGKGTRYWSGPRPASEPETRAIVRFFSKIAAPHDRVDPPAVVVGRLLRGQQGGDAVAVAGAESAGRPHPGGRRRHDDVLVQR